MEYTLDYYIEKFTAIPEELWCMGEYVNEEGQKCAFGHCGLQIDPFDKEEVIETEEAHQLRAIVMKYMRIGTPMYYITSVNDGGDIDYQQPTPKQRVLAFLNDLKNNTNV